MRAALLAPQGVSLHAPRRAVGAISAAWSAHARGVHDKGNGTRSKAMALVRANDFRKHNNYNALGGLLEVTSETPGGLEHTKQL